MTILETKARPNFEQNIVFYATLGNRVELPYFSDIEDRNNHQFKLLGTTNHAMQLSSYDVRVNVFVRDFSAAAMISQAVFCVKFRQAIRPRDSLVELEDEKTIPIIGNGVQSNNDHTR